MEKKGILIKNWSEKAELRPLTLLPNPPAELYYRGHWDPSIFTNCVAVVGSRRMSRYGREVIDRLVPKLVLEKKTVISGMMYGVDQYAHDVCLKSGGRTIGVLGWGIDRVMEPSDENLAREITAQGGLLLSEWLDQTAALWTFPLRNRLVAALSSEVFVIEAAKKSGSLITADLALKFNKILWAVPGPITSPISVGTNELIAEGQARPWLGEAISSPIPKPNHPLLAALINQPLTINELVRETSRPIAEVSAELTMLSIEGQVIEEAGKYYLPPAI